MRGETNRGWRSLAGLAGFVALGLAVGAVGGVVTQTTVGGWYQTLAKPPFNPPDAIFAPVWTTLFVLMSVAAWRVWCLGGWRRGRGDLTLYFIQLGLNVIWSVLFFGLRAPGWALVEIMVLLAAITWTTKRFARRDRWAGVLMAPYVLWVAFAVVLNGAIWRLN